MTGVVGAVFVVVVVVVAATSAPQLIDIPKRSIGT
jgi:hypothetical protein